MTDNVKWFSDLGSDNVSSVGGKNASLGEMIGALKEEGVMVPDGFATTASAYRKFIEHNGIKEKIKKEMESFQSGDKELAEAGGAVRRLFTSGEFPEDIQGDILDVYEQLSQNYDEDETDVAVRSSATAEDLPEASFAGQQETFLNVTGGDELLRSCKKCYASLFTDRAISYREEKGFDHLKVALSVGVQKMVRSDRGGAGVMFTLDTDTGFPDVVVINAAWGLGENVVQGTVTPDEYIVMKPLLDDDSLKPVIGREKGDKEKKMVYAKGGSKTTANKDTSKSERRSFVLDDDETIKLARWAKIIEVHYGKPMDIEWAKDGDSGELFIVQARPETVQSQKDTSSLKAYHLKERGKKLSEGAAIGEALATGTAQIIMSADDIDRFEKGSVLVTEMTDPDWVPIMKQAAAIVTDQGGRTSHAAIVSRELGIPAVVGTGDGTDNIEEGSDVTVSCAEGETGHIYEGKLEYEEEDIDLSEIPDTKTQIMMNIASPAASFRWWRLPTDGVGLARMEFIVNNIIKIHPLALLRSDQVEDKDAKKKIEELTADYDDNSEYFVDLLSRGIAKIAAPHYPDPVIVRMSDFKSNEYANLIGGAGFEPDEENPMLGLRGASRYYSDRYREAFELECRAIKRTRDVIGMKNVIVMVPFCRTLEEADKVISILEDNGLKRGEDGQEVYVMCEIPANVILAEKFAERFDGFSIGSNDLTQLVLGVDRDSEELSELFDERNEAVKDFIGDLLERAKKAGSKVGICGQAPSDYPEFARFLVSSGIDSISLNPDSVIGVKKLAAETESGKGGDN